jgi:hypothetical protein
MNGWELFLGWAEGDCLDPAKRTPPKRGSVSKQESHERGLIGEPPAHTQRAESSGVPRRGCVRLQALVPERRTEWLVMPGCR